MLSSQMTTGRLSRWLFDAIHHRNLVYNQCWEDPAVDREALGLTPEDRVDARLDALRRLFARHRVETRSVGL